MTKYNAGGRGLQDGCKLVEYLITYKKGQHAELIAEIGVRFAQHHTDILSNIEYADRVEDFFMACLDIKLIDWAQVFLKALCTMFPDGIKTMRLLGMFYEAQGKTFRAQEIYEELLESCPHDTQTVKRLISLFKCNDMVGDAVNVLNKYLETNQIDEEAWMELADLHLSR